MSDTNGSALPTSRAYRFGERLAWLLLAALVPVLLIGMGLVARLVWWCLELGWELP